MARRRRAAARAAGASLVQGESSGRRRHGREPERGSAADLPSRSVGEAPRCEVCGEAIAASCRVDCQSCGTPHHADCFAYLGQCAVYGCGSARRKANPIDGGSVSPDLVIVRDVGGERERAGRPAASSRGARGNRGRSQVEVETPPPREAWVSLRILLKRTLLCGIGMLAMSSACSSAVDTPGQAILALIVGIAFLIGGFMADDATMLKLG